MTISIQEAYDALGLTRDATPDQVKKAYRKLALQFHPDKNSDPAATSKFQQLSAAYKRVDDHLKRGPSVDDQMFEDFFGDFDDDEFDFDEMDMPSMEEMLFMFDMLFGAPPPTGRSHGKRKKGKKGVVNLRKGAKRQEPPSFPSYVDQEFMDMFAHGMMFDGAGAELSDLEDEFLSMAGFFGHSSMPFDSKAPIWNSDDEEKPSIGNKSPPKPTKKCSKSAKSLKSTPTIGSKVSIHGKHAGVVMFTGNVHYAKGEFVGVALSSPVGKNDGSIKGVRYFECSPSHGLMVRPNDVTLAA